MHTYKSEDSRVLSNEVIVGLPKISFCKSLCSIVSSISYYFKRLQNKTEGNTKKDSQANTSVVALSRAKSREGDGSLDRSPPEKVGYHGWISLVYRRGTN